MPWVVFLVSKNQNITWYVTQREELSLDIQGLLLDAVECQIPKLYHSPSIEDLRPHENGLVFTPKMIDYIHDIWKQLNNWILDGINKYILDEIKSIGTWEKKFIETYIKNPQLMIPSQTPIRSWKEAFLSNWDKLWIWKIKDHVNNFNI